jgi:hypothetical protein
MGTMNRKLLVGASVVVVGGAAAVVFASVNRNPPPPDHPHPAVSGSSAHAVGIDNQMSAILVMYDASPGSTPCESAYNALKTSQDYAGSHPDVTPVVLRLAPRDEFLQRCGALPPGTQQCLVPAYLSEHRDECAKLKPSRDVLNAMAELKESEKPALGPESLPKP